MDTGEDNEAETEEAAAAGDEEGGWEPFNLARDGVVTPCLALDEGEEAVFWCCCGDCEAPLPPPSFLWWAAALCRKNEKRVSQGKMQKGKKRDGGRTLWPLTA